MIRVRGQLDEYQGLATGGLDYIGSHIIIELIRSNYQPIILDNLSNSNIKILDQIEKISGERPAFHDIDLCNEGKTVALIRSEKTLDSVIHFAAHKAVGESLNAPLKYYRNNVILLLSVLKAFEDSKLNLAFSLSCTVYGQPDILPVDETAPIKIAVSPYGKTKQVAEGILRDITATDKAKNIISLRYFNPVGAHESGMLGELPKGVPQNLVPFITQSAVGKRDAITTFGNDYDTSDGSCIGDYIHVVDLAQAHVAALRFQESNGTTNNYEVFNIGTGKGYTVFELIKAFEQVTGITLQYKIGCRRDGDIERVWGILLNYGTN